MIDCLIEEGKQNSAISKLFNQPKITMIEKDEDHQEEMKFFYPPNSIIVLKNLFESLKKKFYSIFNCLNRTNLILNFRNYWKYVWNQILAPNSNK